MRSQQPPAQEPPTDGLTVGRTAALLGVSVKTLHHWDAIGLVRPGGRTRAGYRVYGDDDVARLHRVLVYREIGIPLTAIGRLLDDPEVDAREHLHRQRGQLVDRISRLERMVGAVDRMLLESKPGIRLTPEEQVEIFGADWQPSWTREAEERWGGTDQWAQYAERAAGMSAEDWKDVAAATEALDADLAAAHRTGVAPGSDVADALAERHRAQISTYFDCTYALQVCIGRTYVTDPGYAAYYDAISPGLNRWLCAVIAANAGAHGVDPESAVRE
ncbi:MULTISPECIES: MerR family transcriptional regulator [unclassified Streptomyces]|uniref:MerR family transcriptional regulator n=1 Tax=unclassified Streptomyces TaxID=2593676 RepID=UPI0037B0C45A